jgi:aminoglycoside phosphotransferase (APT) family kinase protein
MADHLPGLDAARTGRWLAEHLDGTPPYHFDLVAAGGSNLTFRVSDAAGTTWALRRPPEGRALATAHDVDREWRILTALHAVDAGVPVPRPRARCADPAVTGAPFFVMDFVDGTILRTEADAAALDPAEGRAAADSLVAVQAALHAIDVEAVGLGNLGRRTGYVARQLERWKAQVDRTALRPRPALDDLHRRLAATVPPETPTPALVHGDYRFDNVVLAAGRDVAAVLDWELCTLGDPVADACWSLLYWADPGDDDTVLPSAPTLADPIPDRAWATTRYQELSGRRLDDLPWYSAFGWWKMACIVEGVHARRRSGGRGGAPPAGTGAIAARVDRLLEVAGERAEEAGV